jgi:hypothetical protein
MWFGVFQKVFEEGNQNSFEEGEKGFSNPSEAKGLPQIIHPSETLHNGLR